MTFRAFVALLVWLDLRPLPLVIEPYRLHIFDAAFERADDGQSFRYNLVLAGRGKKNAKTLDLVLACIFSLLVDSPGGNQVYLVANDEGQAHDDLELAKKLIAVNRILSDVLTVKKNVIERRDGQGFLEVLPAQDAIGAHGKTYRLLAIDEVHGYRSYDLLEALALDPTRPDAQQWITSYASIYHKPGVPLFDLMKTGREGKDPRMLFSWYAADFTTDPAFADKSPEERANPSMTSWSNPDYLDQQRRRLPAHKYRRLHLNLPGLPEGSAFQPEPVMAAVVRGMADRGREASRTYRAFVDMSGGSHDDAVLAIGHVEDDRAVVDRVLHQGQPTPFDPRLAVERFATVLREYGLSSVTGDRYAGETFRADFQRLGIRYQLATQTRSQLYEALQPWLNGQRVLLPDVPVLEQQLLGLVWRSGKIDHPAGEHDDYANAAAGVVFELLGQRRCGILDYAMERLAEMRAAGQTHYLDTADTPSI
jgi:phage terminase large subunit-like protein